jgi:hypothetical protein
VFEPMLLEQRYEYLFVRAQPLVDTLLVVSAERPVLSITTRAVTGVARNAPVVAVLVGWNTFVTISFRVIIST